MRLLRQRAVWSGMAAMTACGLLTAGVSTGAYAAAPQLSAARPIPGLNALNAGGNARVNSVSCGSPGNCAAAGAYTDASGNLLPFVASEANGTWGNALEVPGIAALSGGGTATASVVSCASAGNCAAGGQYFDSTPSGHVFVAVQASGTWGNAQQLTGTGTSPQLRSVSCATPGNCALGGSGTDASGHVQAFVADLSAATGAAGQIQTTTSLALSAPAVTFGQEQAGQITVTVTAAAGTPRGVVTVTAGKATVCVIVLGSGTGSCRLTPKGLRPGSYALTASYLGGPRFARSASAPATLTVTR